MAKLKKLIEQILLGRSDANIGFDELCHVLTSLGFSGRVRSSHHIFSHPKVFLYEESHRCASQEFFSQLH